MSKLCKDIVIVGGGSAGWITAGVIASKHKKGSSSHVNVTLIESPDIKPIGVGEGTWPTMRNTLRKMGISETEFMRECDVSFKQGAKFAQWVTGKKDDFYYHPLVLPEGFSKSDLSQYWSSNMRSQSFSKSLCFQEDICENNLAPKAITTPEYIAVANYAYHLNSSKFSAFLKKHCIEKLGITFISDNVTGVNSDRKSDDILSVTTESSGNISGDLFVDCTGFSSLIIDKHYKVPFIDKNEILPIDRAIAVQIPYADEDENIASHTISTAQSAGWVWDIGLPNRRGIGHVYSSKYNDEETATKELIDYLKATGTANTDNLTFRHINIRPGHREKFWVNNCVAVGLSAGFLEPLEASALVLIELSAAMISEQMPKNREAMTIIAKRFNNLFAYRWARIIDFLKLHYVLSKRRDTSFWCDVTSADNTPESLKELLALWKFQPPWIYDFDHAEEVFPAASYQYVLYGMGFETAKPEAFSQEEVMFAEQQLNNNKKNITKLIHNLPTNRELINKVKQYGFQKV